MNKKAFVSWSGGKEACLACFKAVERKTLKVKCLLNMVSEDGTRSRTHGLSADMLKLQAEAMGISIIQKNTGWQGYEEEFKKALLGFKKEGIDTGIFGDIDIQAHRDWVEKTCKDVGVKPILPLWKKKRENLLEEFICAGFKAIVVAVKAEFLGSEWLGRKIDGKFIKELKAIDNVDLCGENGEYHTFVYDGPIFKRPVEFIMTERTSSNKHWFLKLKGCIK